jgi:hypothetical protein
MNYTLYLKTHNKTGLKYLGMTTQPDPKKYKGSGKHWQNHIQKHGYDVSTEILYETTVHSDFKTHCQKISEELDVVRDRAYANLIPETGDSTNLMGQKAAVKITKGSIWVNDGEHDYRIQSGYIPGGFKRGRLKKSKWSTPTKTTRYVINGEEIRWKHAVEKYGVGIKKHLYRLRNNPELEVWHKKAYLDKPALTIEVIRL